MKTQQNSCVMCGEWAIHIAEKTKEPLCQKCSDLNKSVAEGKQT